METNIDGPSAWSRLAAQWQSAVLVAACVAGGLTLTIMVIGSTPEVLVEASEAAIETSPVDASVSEPAAVTEVPADTAPSTDPNEVVDPTVAEAAVPDPGRVSPAALESATVVAPAPAAPAPAAPASAPRVTPTTQSPSGATQAPVVTSGPLAPVTVVAPQSTAPPITQPPPTTVAPSPTTAAPVTAVLTYPSYSAGSAATVVLQFDGSSISVASVNRQANWVSQVDKNGPSTVEIKFFNTATQQDEEFHATVESGRIKVEN